MKVGFTGTRQGMTDAQRVSFVNLIKQLAPTEFRHGDCLGADKEAAFIVFQMEDWVTILCHPPTDKKYRAFTTFNDVVHPAKSHFARNRDIVDASDVLVAVSLMPQRQESGGTWYTIDYALKKGKPVWVLWPSGTGELLRA